MSKIQISRMYLTMQIVADSFDEKGWDFVFSDENDGPRFSGAQICYDQETFFENQIYLLPPGTSFPDHFSPDRIAFIAFGEAEAFQKYKAPHIILPTTVDVLAVLNFMQLILQKCHAWEAKLTSIITNDGSLYELCEAGIEFFGNPLYIHDSFFNILAQPKWVQGMLVTELNHHTGKRVIPLELVNEFKLSDDYINTLDLRGSQIWDVDQVCYGMRSMYVNVWDHHKYRARILMNELQTPFTTSTFYAFEYFSEYAKFILRRDMAEDHGKYMMFEDVFRAYMLGENANLLEMRRGLNALGWNNEDTYICLKLQSSQHDLKVQAISALCSISFVHGDTICTLVNTTKGNLSVQDIRTLLAPIVRDSLLYCGTSNGFSPIFMLDSGFRQAEISLRMAQREGNTQWYLPFTDCALEYIVSLTEKELPAELFCAPELILLKKHDLEKGTDYFQTIKTYLSCQQDSNATAKALFIHRTTLGYRLEKINKLVPIKLETEYDRLYFQLSALIIEHTEAINPSIRRSVHEKLPEQLLK